MLSNIIAIFAIVVLMYSCSNAESAARKNTALKKNADSSQQSSAKSSMAAPVSDSTKTAQATPPKADRQLIVYYFHGNARCPTCYKLESFAKSEVEIDFADAVKNGTLLWKTINIEDRGNEHYAEEYKLYTKSVIVSIRQDGKESSWKNLDQIWQLVREEQKYREYIKNEVKACLDGKCL